MDTLQAGIQTTNVPETKSVRPKDKALIPLPCTQARFQDDQREHWLLQGPQDAIGAAQNKTVKETAQSYMFPQPVIENSEDQSEIVELSREYRQLANDAILRSRANTAGPLLSEQDHEQHRPLQGGVPSNHLITILNRHEITSMLLKQQQLFNYYL